MKKIKKICGNCLLYDGRNGLCKVAIIHEGEKINLPVSKDDNCHMDELEIPVEQIRWWVEDEKGDKTNGDGIVKVEYPKSLLD